MEKVRRVLAIVAVVIIAGLYVTTLILAISGGEKTAGLLTASIAATIVFPCVLYLFKWLSDMSKKK